MMNDKVVAELKVCFENLVKEPPFNGRVTHRTRAAFLAKWKEIVAEKGVTSFSYVDDMLRLMGK